MTTIDTDKSVTTEGEGRKSPPLLLIDIKNTLYRVAYASKSSDEGILIMLRLFSDWIKQFKPSGLVAAWDAPRNTVWRRDHHLGYKNRDSSRYVDDLGPRIAEMSEISRELFTHLGIQQLSRDRMEADDLIYACASALCPDECVIISSDSDMTQIPFLLRNASVYNAQKEQMSEGTNILAKAIAGDRSDSVRGYEGVGKVKASRIINERDYRRTFFNDRGWETLRESMLLVDLQSCPFLLDNKIYCIQVLSEAIKVDTMAATEVVRRHKCKLVFVESQRLFPIFRAVRSSK
jgi:5'-3' exonuclease